MTKRKSKPRKRTEKCPYQSRYSDSYIRADQYIAELICEKKARCDGKDLPRKFWNLPEWSQFFKQHLRQIAKLLKKYEATTIIQALTSYEAGWKYSLFTDYMLELIENFHQKRLLNLTKERQVVTLPEGETFSTHQAKKTVVDTLIEMEHGQKEK